MKPYGRKKQLMRGKIKCHTSDMCDICSTNGWKISKKRERKFVIED